MSTAPGKGMLQLMVTPASGADVTPHLWAFDVDVLHLSPDPDTMAAPSRYLIDSRVRGEARRVRLSRALLPMGGGDAPELLHDEDMIRNGIKPLVIEGDVPVHGERADQYRRRAVRYLTHKIVPEYERGVVSTVVMADADTVWVLAKYIAERNVLGHTGRAGFLRQPLTPGTTLWFESDGMLLRHVTTTGP